MQMRTSRFGQDGEKQAGAGARPCAEAPGSKTGTRGRKITY